MTSEAMIAQLKKVFNSSSSFERSVGLKIKEELTEHADQETMYGGYRSGSQSDRNWNRGRSGQGNQYSASLQQSDKSPSRYPNEQASRYSTEQKGVRSKSKKGKNPLETSGNITRCRECESVKHWEKDCPDLQREEQRTYLEDCQEETDSEDDNGYDGYGHNMSSLEETCSITDAEQNPVRKI